VFDLTESYTEQSKNPAPKYVMAKPSITMECHTKRLLVAQIPKSTLKRSIPLSSELDHLFAL